MKNLIISANITILEDEAIKIDDKAVLVGRKDSSLIGNQGENRSDISYKLEEISDCLPIVVLDHQPSNIDEYKHADLILSGHTHQEQEHGRAVILKNNIPRYLVIDFSKVYNDIVASSEDVLNISKRLIEKNRKYARFIYNVRTLRNTGNYSKRVVKRGGNKIENEK